MSSFKPSIAVTLSETQPLNNYSLSSGLRDFLRLLPIPGATDPEILEVVLAGEIPAHYVEAGNLADRYLPYVRETPGDRFRTSRPFIPYWVAAAVLLGVPAHEVIPYSGRFHVTMSLKSKSPTFSWWAASACLAKYREYA